jgi:hypothetical protein
MFVFQAFGRTLVAKGRIVRGFRLFRLDDAGHFTSVEIIAAESDQEAVKAAQDLLQSDAGELWYEARRICKLDLRQPRSD